jgi:aminomethyltransferase
MAKISPFHQIHQTLGAAFDEFDGWQLPRDFGSPQTEQNAILTHCAAVDLSSFGRISLKGDWQNLLNLADIRLSSPLVENRWAWAVFNGSSAFQRLRIGKIGSEGLILTLPGQDQPLLNRLRQMAADLKPQPAVIDLSETTGMLGLYGPNAFHSAAKLVPFDLDDLQPQGAVRLSLFMFNLFILRGSWLDSDGLELLCPASAGTLAAGSIAKAGQKYNILPAGMAAFRELLTQKKLL